MFQPVARTSASGAVFDQISVKVLAGELAAGEALPSERKLAEAFGVSRPAVREAMQKLAQAGLVEVRQGESTSVRDFRRQAGPELLPQLLVRGGIPDLSVVRSVLEARELMGPQIAALAARRVSPEHGIELHAAVDHLAATNDPVEQQNRALAFWEFVVDDADSIAFRLIFNSLRTAYEPAMTALAAVMVAEVGQTDLYRKLATAITSHDELTSAALAGELLRSGTTTIGEALTFLEGLNP
ncbi:GntR family transcriptional regulator [Rhodococcus sp. IEGM 1379]|uniref:FadR/GntR family transcriptional regulator n=1 Tax=Rhodococcus sp. IEGM 1379 TaxID=3047086 RepID=UPI0024B7621E|nr:GntR family transcriptional regulator [Rhodococcus sp. IEGM 1379]MDI9917799.1 GntR family transcriptional regulator [Rhodococcus sp. IEGM 1379]